MTEFNKPRPTPEDEAFNDIERQAKQRQESVKASFEAMYPIVVRNLVIEEVAQHIEKLKGFGTDTIDSLTVYIRSMKK